MAPTLPLRPTSLIRPPRLNNAIDMLLHLAPSSRPPRRTSCIYCTTVIVRHCRRVTRPQPVSSRLASSRLISDYVTVANASASLLSTRSPSTRDTATTLPLLLFSIPPPCTPGPGEDARLVVQWTQYATRPTLLALLLSAQKFFDVVRVLAQLSVLVVVVGATRRALSPTATTCFLW